MSERDLKNGGCKAVPGSLAAGGQVINAGERLPVS